MLSFKSVLCGTSAVLCFLLVLVNCSYGQNKTYNVIEFSEKSDYKKFEPEIKEMADYFLGRPATDDQASKTILANIVKWMSGTPDHHFVVDQSIMALTKNNEQVLGIYMACATKVALQNGAGMDAKALKLSSFEVLLDYCGQKENGVKINKEMKKAIEAKERGKLKEYLNI
jgi:hypothetical protein